MASALRNFKFENHTRINRLQCGFESEIRSQSCPEMWRISDSPHWLDKGGTGGTNWSHEGTCRGCCFCDDRAGFDGGGSVQIPDRHVFVQAFAEELDLRTDRRYFRRKVRKRLEQP